MLLQTLRQLFRRAKPLRPTTSGKSYAEAYRLYQEGQLEEAEIACTRLTGAAPADVHFLRGLIWRERRNYESAAAAFKLAVEARDNESTFHYSFAETLLELGRHQDARRHIERFLLLAGVRDPRLARAWMMLFACRIQAGDTGEAEECAANAITAARQDPAALVSVADSFFLEGRIENARNTLNLRIKSSDSFATRLRRAAMLPQVYDSRSEIEGVRERFARDLDELLSQPAMLTDSPQHEVGIVPFYLAYHNANNIELLRKYCSAARRAFSARAVTPRSQRSHRIRVGFVSTYFYSHSVARTTIGLIKDLPRPRFYVHVFAVEPAADPMAIAIAAAADEYQRLRNDIQQIVEAISAAELDVLVFADIGMHPTTYFLALNRLAPVQIATWGHSETSGIDTVDYYLSADGVECEAAEAHYSETLLRPRAFFLPGYERPTPVAAQNQDFSEMPSGHRVYACLQPEFKLHPDMDHVFKSILETDPQGAIVLLRTRRSWSDLIQHRLARLLGEELSRRVHFLSRMSHDRFLAALGASDVCLDPLYFGGCNSSCETMALGVPLVTLPGRHLYGRFTAAMYDEMDIHDCVASSIDDYVARATGIANNRDWRHAVANEIRSRSNVLFGRKDITLALAEFLEERVALSV